MPKKSIIIKTERPEDLSSPHKGFPKQRRKMNEDNKEEDPQEPQVKIQRSKGILFPPHPSTVFDCSRHMNRPKQWKEDGMKVTFNYVKTMNESIKGYLKLKSNKWHIVPVDPTARIHKIKQLRKMSKSILIGWYEPPIFEYYIQWTQENKKKTWLEFNAEGKLPDIKCEQDDYWELLESTDYEKRWCYSPSESESESSEESEKDSIMEHNQNTDGRKKTNHLPNEEVIIIGSDASDTTMGKGSDDDNSSREENREKIKQGSTHTPTKPDKLSTITPPSYKTTLLQEKPSSYILMAKCREVNELRHHSNNSQSTGEAGSSHRTLHKVQLGIWVPANRNNYEEVTKCLNKFLLAVSKIEGGDKNAVKVAKFSETQPNKDLITTFGEGKYPGKQLETYVLNVRSYTKDKAGTQYIRLNLSVLPSVDFKTLLTELNTGEWGDRPRQFIRMAPSKCNEPVLIGYLLRSHWTMTATKDMTDFHMMNSGMRIGFMPKEIKYGTGASKDSREIARFKQAQYVECEKKDLKKAMKYCRTEWPTKNKRQDEGGPSLGYKCAFIAIRNESGNLLPRNERFEESVIEQQIATTQKLFVLEAHTGFLTAQLDYEFDLHGSPGTLRQFIATIQTLPDDQGKRRDLFQAVSRGERSNQVHFIMLKPFAEEGRHVLNALPLIVRDTLCLDPHQFFTEDTVNTALEGTWNPKTRVFQEYGEIQNKEAVDDGFDDIPGLKEALEARDSDRKHMTVNLPGVNDAPMTAKALKNFHRAMNEDDETATFVSPSERVIKRLAPMGKEGPQVWTPKVPNAPPISVEQEENSITSTLTGNTRESKLNRQHIELTTRYNAVIEKKEEAHQKEMKEMKEEQEKMKQMIESLMKLQATKVGPGAGESARNE